MASGSMTARLASGVLFCALATSCSLRLPVEPPPHQRVEVACAVTTPPPAAEAEIDPASPPDLLVWMLADSWHTGMVFPYDWLLDSGFIPPAGFGNPRYVALSWGNRDAYSEAGFDHPWKVFRVLFTPTPSVMELIPIHWDVAEVSPGQRIWRKLVPRDRGPAVAHFLNQCSAVGEDGRPIVVTRSSWGAGVQLECRHPYFIPRVCNVWTAQLIEAMGGEVNPWLGLTAEGLIRQAEKPPNGFELIWPGTGIETR
jgi:hypothetical protein